MNKGVITISYRQVIDHSSNTAFARNVYHLSYQEFLLKSQVYNTGAELKTFSQMKAKDGRANSLHYKSGFAASGHIEALKGNVPGIADEAGASLQFETYRFELLESNIEQIEEHRVAIHYITGVLTLIAVIGDRLLLAYGNQLSKLEAGESVSTFLLTLQPGINIDHYAGS